jgi:hypothetical protein
MLSAVGEVASIYSRLLPKPYPCILIVQPVSANKALENGINACCERLAQYNNASQQDIYAQILYFYEPCPWRLMVKFGRMGCRSFCLKYTKRMMYFEVKCSNHSNVFIKRMYLVLSQSKKKWSSLSWHLWKSLY